jgi:hypothetical protein
MSKTAIVITYALAVVACVLIIVSLACAASGSADLAGYLAGMACFCLLLCIWANVCS